MTLPSIVYDSPGTITWTRNASRARSGTGTNQQIILATPIATTGLVTPIDSPVANSPQAGTQVTATSVTFDVQGVTGATQYMVEVSSDPNFRTNVRQQILPVQAASQRTGSVSQTIDVTRWFASTHGTLWWHAGARNAIDSPGPDPGIYANAPGDRYWVYSLPESFIVP